MFLLWPWRRSDAVPRFLTPLTNCALTSVRIIKFLSEPVTSYERRQHMSSVVTNIASLDPETESPAFLKQDESPDNPLECHGMAHVCTDRKH
jgi:hypothetical protein